MPLTFRPVFRECFKTSWDREDPQDRFAGTFIAKCDMLRRWDCCTGAFYNSVLVGATVLTFSRKTPSVANLQLMHTFSKHRNKGYGTEMLKEVLRRAGMSSQYFRVSSEPDAVGFYRKQGLKFWGMQKSGCLLCIAKINTDGTHSYDFEDAVIRSAVDKRGRGGVTTRFAAGAT